MLAKGHCGSRHTHVKGQVAVVSFVPLGKADIDEERQDHAVKIQGTLVGATENAEVADMRGVLSAVSRHQGVDEIARLRTHTFDAYIGAHHYRGENPSAHFQENDVSMEMDDDSKQQATKLEVAKKMAQERGDQELHT